MKYGSLFIEYSAVLSHSGWMYRRECKLHLENYVLKYEVELTKFYFWLALLPVAVCSTQVNAEFFFCRKMVSFES
jgi:hypothetical protein